MNVITLPQPVAISPHRIHPQTRPGYVHLKVANLENQLVFYQQTLGLRLHWKDGNSAGLGAGDEVVEVGAARHAATLVEPGRAGSRANGACRPAGNFLGGRGV